MNCCFRLRCLILLSLLQNITDDLRAALSPLYTDLLSCILNHLSRSISPTALPALSEMFSSLFKFLLVPAVSTTFLKWTLGEGRGGSARLSRTVCKQSKGQWRRFGRHSCGSRRRLHVRRRLLYSQEGVIGVGDATARVFVYACKVHYDRLFRLVQF